MLFLEMTSLSFQMIVSLRYRALSYYTLLTDTVVMHGG